jgi:hypothetical protein
MKKARNIGFLLVVGLWILLAFLCYSKIIIFDNTTLSGAMLSSLVLTSSILNIIRLLKMIYDGVYSTLVQEND